MEATGVAGRGRVIAIMQPYFLPYIGYWQLLGAVDEFILYDDVQYIKGGWVNRNRVLIGGAPAWLSVPVGRHPANQSIGEKRLAAEWHRRRAKILRSLHEAYAGAPYRDDVVALLEGILGARHERLIDLLVSSITGIASALGIGTPVLRSSGLQVDGRLRGQERVLAICRMRGAGTYVNPVGGNGLYCQSTFSRHGVRLRFLMPEPDRYEQRGDRFVDRLSIVDMMMWGGSALCRENLAKYRLLSASELNTGGQHESR